VVDQIDVIGGSKTFEIEEGTSIKGSKSLREGTTHKRRGFLLEGSHKQRGTIRENSVKVNRDKKSC